MVSHFMFSPCETGFCVSTRREKCPYRRHRGRVAHQWPSRSLNVLNGQQVENAYPTSAAAVRRLRHAEVALGGH